MSEVTTYRNRSKTPLTFAQQKLKRLAVQPRLIPARCSPMRLLIWSGVGLLVLRYDLAGRQAVHLELRRAVRRSTEQTQQSCFQIGRGARSVLVLSAVGEIGWDDFRAVDVFSGGLLRVDVVVFCAFLLRTGTLWAAARYGVTK